MTAPEHNYIGAVAHLVRLESDRRRWRSGRDLKWAIIGEKNARAALPADADVHALRRLAELEALGRVAA